MTARTGRPSGRPMGSPDKLKRTSKEIAGRDALSVLVGIAIDKSEDSAIRVQAASIILTHSAGAIIKTDAAPGAMAPPAPHGAET